MPTVLEQVQFRIKPSATRPQFQQAMDRAQTWIRAQKGFEFSTVSADDKDMTHHVFWASQTDADAASAAIGQAAETADLLSVIDHSTIRMNHYPIVHAFGPAPEAAHEMA